jgi:hypothetical protein
MPNSEPNFLRGTATLAIAALIAVGLVFSLDARAETSANAKSPVGVNLSRVNYYTPEQPFLNVFKTSGVSKANPRGWITHSNSKFDTSEEAYLQLDANGYPTTLQAGSADPNSPQLYNAVGALLLRNLPNSNGGAGLPYRAGQYVVLYDGEGTLSYGFDASLVSHSPGRDVVNVAHPTAGGGVLLLITSTDPKHDGNYVRNIRVVKAEEESLLNQGQMFTPKFVGTMQNFHVIRFMQWSEIDNDGGMAGTWENRTHTGDAGWGGPDGVPLEVDIQLANTVSADPWLNVPADADDNYIRQMATLVRNTLSPGLRVYVEFSNEVWNTSYPQYNYAAQQGKAKWPSASVSANDDNRNWFGMRTAQMCDIWKSVWGGDYSRVVCVLGAQAANVVTATESLNCALWTDSGNAPCAAHNINAVAIAPYFFNFRALPAWFSASDGGVSDIFQQLNGGGLLTASLDGPNGDMARVSGWEAAYKKALAPYNLPFVAYEGGQSLVAVSSADNTQVLSLYIAANRDTRMGAAYTSALDQWKANGGQVYVLYDDIDAPTLWGEWGALETFMDPISPLSSSPSKWQAIQKFISGNPCWWTDCAGAVTADVPQAPPNFRATN